MIIRIRKSGLVCLGNICTSLLALAAILWTGGCLGRHQPQEGADLLNDKVTTARVQSVLSSSTNQELKQIEVTTTNGIVTMSGTVKSQGEKDKADELARTVKRVRELHNEIAVQSP